MLNPDQRTEFRSLGLKNALANTWEIHLNSATHPMAPTLGEILAKRFTPEEAREFERIMRPHLERGQTEQKELNAYLTAEKLPKA